MYVLTIVYLASQVLVQSVYLNRDWCEEAARFALGFDSGSQAVQSARCDIVPAPAASAPR